MKAKAARMCVEKGSRDLPMDVDDPQTIQTLGELTTRGRTQVGGGRVRQEEERINQL